MLFYFILLNSHQITDTVILMLYIFVPLDKCKMPHCALLIGMISVFVIDNKCKE